jgi:hypothetical protein
MIRDETRILLRSDRVARLIAPGGCVFSRLDKLVTGYIIATPERNGTSVPKAPITQAPIFQLTKKPILDRHRVDEVERSKAGHSSFDPGAVSRKV